MIAARGQSKEIGWPSEFRASLVLGLQGTGKRKREYMRMRSHERFKNLGNDYSGATHVVLQRIPREYRPIWHISRTKNIFRQAVQTFRVRDCAKLKDAVGEQRLYSFSSHPTPKSYARPRRSTCYPHERRRARSLCKVCSFMKRLDIVPSTASPKIVKNTPDKAAI